MLIIQSKGKASGTGSCSRGSAATVRKQQDRVAIPWIPALLRTQVHVPGTEQAQTPLTTVNYRVILGHFSSSRVSVVVEHM